MGAFGDMSSKMDCEREFGDIEDVFPPSGTTVLCMIAIILLTIVIECAAHGWGKEECCYDDSQHNAVPSVPIESNETTTASNSQPPQASPSADKPERSLKKDHEHVPSPTVRANRLLLASASMVPLCFAFITRIREAQFVYPDICQRVLTIAPTQWWVIALFAVVPFAGACIAWLRTLVDSILVRFDKNIKADVWPAVWPLFMACAAVAMVGIAIRDMVLLAMGRKDLTVMAKKKDGEDIEMHARGGVVENEEERGLLGDGEVRESEDDERTVYSPRSSLEGEGKLSSPV